MLKGIYFMGGREICEVSSYSLPMKNMQMIQDIGI